MIILINGGSKVGKKEAVKIINDIYKFEIMNLEEIPILEDKSFVESLDNYILTDNRWKRNFVLNFSLNKKYEIEMMRKRPFFYLLGIESPLLVRYKRASTEENYTDFIQFAIKDEESYENVHHCLHLADKVIVNASTLSNFEKVILDLDLLNCNILRPSWDCYFMRLAFLASTRSNCMKRRVGCVLVKDNRVVSTGYNGTPRGLPNCSEGGCPRCNSNAKCGTDLDLCLCIHAEENGLLEAGVCRAQGSTVYATSFPCLGCTKKIIQVQVKEIVFCEGYATDAMATKLLNMAGITITQFNKSIIPMHFLNIDNVTP